MTLNITLSAESLLGASNRPGWLEGHGPIPADLAREIAAGAANTWVRRLLTEPASGVVIDVERRRRAPREFTGMLRDLIVLRDRECRQPWCDAPIRHADHIVPHARGGPTSADNGQGLCARGNYLKEVPGWDSWREADGTYVCTPTGHVYRTAVATTRGLPARTEPVENHFRPGSANLFRRNGNGCVGVDQFHPRLRIVVDDYHSSSVTAGRTAGPPRRRGRER